MPEQKDCVVKLVDGHGVEHSLRVRAESVYEAALKGLKRLKNVSWDAHERTSGSLIVEVWEQPTRHRVNIATLLRWLNQPGRTPRDQSRKAELRKFLE
jgi:hypothetical protein